MVIAHRPNAVAFSAAPRLTTLSSELSEVVELCIKMLVGRRNSGVERAARKHSEMNKTRTRAAILLATRPSDRLELPSTPE
jgi:hypothetical protein